MPQVAGRLAPPCGLWTRCTKAEAEARAGRCAAECGSQGRTSYMRSRELNKCRCRKQRGIGTVEISIALQLHATRGWYGTDDTISGFVVRPEFWAGQGGWGLVRSTMRCPFRLQIHGSSNLTSLGLARRAVPRAKLVLTGIPLQPVRLL